MQGALRIMGPRVVLLLATAGVWPLAGPFAGAGTAEAATARVIYVTGGSVYVDAGRSQGVETGDTLEVLRDGELVARLRVAFVSTAKSSCDTLQSASPIRVGDSVRYRARAAVPAGPGDAAGSTPGGGPAGGGAAGGTGTDSLRAARPLPLSSGGEPAKRRARPLRGRVGLGLVTVPGPGGGSGYTQPSLAVRLEGVAEAGAPIDFSIDARGHRTYRDGGSNGIARVYRLFTAVHDDAGTRRLSIGRQPLPVSSSAGLFDGALAQVGGARWAAGVFSGLEPAPGGYDFSTDVVQSGGFLQWRNAPASARRWTATAGFIDSRDRGSPSRDFAFVQGSWMSRSLLASVSQELDINASWKRAMGEPAVEPTSTFATARVQAAKRLSLSAGYDNRRNVRLYRDRETPETAFDDSHREGGWLGATVDARSNVRVSASGRVRSGGAAGTVRTGSGSIEAYRLTSLHAAARLRTTRVDGHAEDGWLHSAGIEITPWAGIRLGTTVGAQRFTDAVSGTRRSVDWQSLDADVGLARRWYLLLSAEHDADHAGDRVQSYSSLNWVF